MSGYMFHEQQVYRMVNDNGVLPVNFYGFEAVKFAEREAVVDKALEIIDKEIQLAKDCKVSTVTLWRVRQGIFALKGGME